MDYHSLARKDLQALCKLNKIPANITNVAMAEALGSLCFVKGIEKLCESTRPVASVKTVQRVYNTRLSARLLKKELMEESKQKECVEAFEIGTYCDNDFGEVSEDHNLLDDVGVDSCLSETDTVTEDVLADEGCVEVELSFSENELQSESLKRGNGKNLDAQVTDSIGVKAVVLNEKVELLQMDSEKGVIDTPIHKTKAVTLILTPQKKASDDIGVDFSFLETKLLTESSKRGIDKNLDTEVIGSSNMKGEILNRCVEVEFSFSENELQSESLKRGNGKNLDAQVTDSIGVKAVVLNEKVELLQMDSEKGVVDTPIHKTKAVTLILSPRKKASDDVGVDFSYLETKLLTESSKRGNDKNLDTEVMGSIDMKGEILNRFDNVGGDLFLSETEQENESQNWKNDKELDAKGTAATFLKSKVPMDKVEGIQVVTLKPMVEMPSHDNKAAIDRPHHKMRDDVVVEVSLPEENATSEVLAHEVELLLMGSEMPIHETKDVEQVFSPQKKGSDDVEVHFSFSESDEHVDAADICSTDSKESESLKEQLQMESSEKVNYDGCVHDFQQKSGKIVFECWSSAANNFVDGGNLDISVKIQQDISCHAEYGGVYDNVKELTSQEVSGKAVASYPIINSESYGRTENPIHNSSGDDTPADIDNFQHNGYSKKSDSKGKRVGEILSDNSAMEITNQLEMTGSIEATDFSGRVAFVDESGDDDKDRLAVDPKSISKTELDFSEYAICSKHQDRKGESMASQLLGGSCTKEPADQSETQGSFDLSVGSNKVTSNHQYVSGKSLTKESRLRVASDVSYCCFGIKKMSFDESQQASEVKSPSIAICSKQQDRKRESIVSQLLGGSYTEEPADQSETPDSSVGFSSNVATINLFMENLSCEKSR